MITTFLKMAATKLVPAIKAFGVTLARVNRAVVNKATPMMVNAIRKGGIVTAKVVTNPKAKAIVQASAKALSNKKLVQAVLHDAVFKVEKAAIKRVPVVGKPVGKVLDIADGIIGVPFI